MNKHLNTSCRYFVGKTRNFDTVASLEDIECQWNPSGSALSPLPPDLLDCVKFPCPETEMIHPTCLLTGWTVSPDP